MMTRWPSPAKLNLFLYITGQRADGYHTLQTLFQFLDYGDTLTIEPRTDGQLRLLTPVEPEEKWYLVAHPGVSIPTPIIFRDPELPRNTPRRSINTLLNCEFSNDCELIARKRFREVDAALSWLLEYAPSRLTGTGACVFAEFNTESAARQVLDTAPAWLNGFVARGVNLSPLKQALL